MWNFCWYHAIVSKKGPTINLRVNDVAIKRGLSVVAEEVVKKKRKGDLYILLREREMKVTRVIPILVSLVAAVLVFLRLRKRRTAGQRDLSE